MIVRRSDFHRILDILSTPGPRSLDTETTGLRPYQGDRLFSIIISDEDKDYYFNFQEYPGLATDWVLTPYYLEVMKDIFNHPESEWFMSNAKFDLAMLANEGIGVAGPIHCTQALSRLEANYELKHSLDACAKRIGLEKSDEVKKCIDNLGLWEWQVIPGKKKRFKKMFFNKVPFEVIVPYGCKDAQVTRAVALHQQRFFHDCDLSTAEGLPNISSVVENEKRFTKTAFKLERNGIKIDLDYCKSAAAYEEARYSKSANDFFQLTGTDFKDSAEALQPAFFKEGEEIEYTEAGAPSFTDAILSTYTSPVAKVVQDYRDAYKKCNTYYRNFIYYMSEDGRIHANIKQSGTATGRVSVTDPALQTLPDEEDEKDLEYKVRRAFIPSPGMVFVMLDYEQMEYRMMLDYAGQDDLISEVQAGVDVHEATANTINSMLGLEITRGTAKTLNFGLLYGMGKDALAASLGTSVEQAITLKKAYFRALPAVQSLIHKVTKRAESLGYVFNWAGRRSYFPDPQFCYKAANYLIQGGCGDAVKVAMNLIDAMLQDYATRMIMQVHDELLFEMPENEMHLIGPIKEIMENAYPYKKLKLTCSMEHSFKSWGDKEKGFPVWPKGKDLNGIV